MNILEILSTPTYDNTVEGIEFHSYKPYITSFNRNDEIRIPINQQDLYTLPSASTLYLEGTIIVNKKDPKEKATSVFSIKGRHLHQFFPSVRERLDRTWLEVDHCVAQFLTGHGNFKSKLFYFKLVDSPFCQCSTSDCEYEQSAHHILWECSLWQNERNIMLDSVQITSGVIYYTDLVGTRANFRAFKRFCHTYY